MRIKPWPANYCFACLFLFLLSNLSPVWAEPVTTVRNNGDPDNRVDIAILGDGYTSAEMAKYASDVNTVVNLFFNQEPFREYQNYFNVHRVDVVSSESGADHPETGVYKNTALDATFNYGGILRLLVVNNTKVNTILSSSLNANQRDIVMVLVNDTTYGGSGGSIAVGSMHSSSVEIMLHEVGHSFGLLADEYDTSPPTCNNTVEPSEPNVTKATGRSLIKWNTGGGPPVGWIELSTSIPTSGTVAGLVGLYEGAKYCTSGLYRPTYASKMRTLAKPFEQVNEEQLVKRIYNWVSPLDSSTPSAATLTIPKGQSQAFQVDALEPYTHSLTASWYLNGQYKQSGLLYTLQTNALNPGAYNVEVVVRDATAKVRNDPSKLLEDSRTWNVQVTGGARTGNLPWLMLLLEE